MRSEDLWGGFSDGHKTVVEASRERVESLLSRTTKMTIVDRNKVESPSVGFLSLKLLGPHTGISLTEIGYCLSPPHSLKRGNGE